MIETIKKKLMKKIFTVCILLALFCLSGIIKAQIPTKGLVAYYPFNGNANDESGNGKNGTVIGANLSSDRFGNANSAYIFDGNSGTERYISSNIGQHDTISFVAWFKSPYPTTYYPTIMSYGGGSNRLAIQIMGNHPIYINNGNIGKFSAQSGISGDVWSKTNTADNNWHFIVASFIPNDSIFLYIDHQLKTATAYNSINPTDGSLFIGRQITEPGAPQTHETHFNGSIDDLRIYNRVLNTTEISSLYKEGTCTAPQPHVNDTSLCGGGVTILKASAGTNYIWYSVPAGGTQINSGSTYTTPFLTATTTYYVSNYDGTCESERDTVTVTVNSLPSLTINPIVDYVNINANPVSLSGSQIGGLFSGVGITGNSFNPANAGLGLKKIHYSYIDGNGCSKTVNDNIIVFDTTGIICSEIIHVAVTDTLIIDVTLSGTNPPNNTNTIKVFPNPTNDHITISFGDFSSMVGYKLVITNSLGQVVFTTPINQQSSYVDLSTWSSNGIYFIQIIDAENNTIENRKIILQ